MKLHLLLLAAILFPGDAARSAEPERAFPIRITLHDSSGRSSVSAPDDTLELNLFRSHTHMHLRLSNTSDQEVTLWRPNCPKGDDAMIVEFRDPGSPGKVFRARPNWAYTGGMGLPRTVILAAHDDLIVNLDFIGGMNWLFPMPIMNGESRDLEVRVGYRSQKLTDEERKSYGDYKAGEVLEGETMGDWQKLTVRNRSGSNIEGQP